VFIAFSMSGESIAGPPSRAIVQPTPDRAA
jgi:hypothetical protein